MANAYNIPSVAAGTVIDELTELYTTAVETDTLAAIPSVCLWGPMGVGKSAAVRAIADRLTARIGQEVCVTEIRLLNFSPVDLRGIPAADAQKEFTVWLKPKIFDLEEGRVHILFLDEISAAPQSLQASAYQIALDKRIGEFDLPENCIVICAGNRTTDRSVAFRMPKALANRLLHFEVLAEFDSWYLWAAAQGIDARVIGYLSFDHSRLSVEADAEELAFPTPRSWEFVSRLLQTTGKQPAEIHELIAGCVGVSTATEFEAWCRVYRSLPAVEDILSGRELSPKGRSADVLYALNASLLTCAKQKKLTSRELEHLIDYAVQFPPDYAVLFFRGLLQTEDMNLRLMKVPSFAAWMKKNKRFL